jgi:hypothetical protein
MNQAEWCPGLPTKKKTRFSVTSGTIIMRPLKKKIRKANA